jgi:hypothetical protein
MMGDDDQAIEGLADRSAARMNLLISSNFFSSPLIARFKVSMTTAVGAPRPSSWSRMSAMRVL